MANVLGFVVLRSLVGFPGAPKVSADPEFVFAIFLKNKKGFVDDFCLPYVFWPTCEWNPAKIQRSTGRSGLDDTVGFTTCIGFVWKQKKIFPDRSLVQSEQVDPRLPEAPIQDSCSKRKLKE
ncbi:MAG: hypothetical protein CMF59_18670 [Leptospiraceae bacterium]|nr:hypothetical protein [Leptospiraceae bacterium]